MAALEKWWLTSIGFCIQRLGDRIARPRYLQEEMQSDTCCATEFVYGVASRIALAVIGRLPPTISINICCMCGPQVADPTSWVSCLLGTLYLYSGGSKRKKVIDIGGRLGKECEYLPWVRRRWGKFSPSPPFSLNLFHGSI